PIRLQRPLPEHVSWGIILSPTATYPPYFPSNPDPTVECERLIMQRERFWFGTVMASVPVLFLLLAICPGVEFERSGPVVGHVRLHGRPLARASVFFIPEDTQHGNWALGFADDNGHFAIGSEWHREVLKGKARFRICIVPDQGVQSGEVSPGLGGAGVP